MRLSGRWAIWVIAVLFLTLTQIAWAQDARPVVMRYHPLFERTLWWGMNAEDVIPSFDIGPRQPISDGGFLVGSERQRKTGGQLLGNLIPVAPGVMGVAPHERFTIYPVFGADGRLRRLDLGLANKTARPLFAYGEPVALWRWESKTVAKNYTEFAWIMGPYQIARAIKYVEEGSQSVVNNASGRILDQGSYRNERIVWAALEYAPPGSIVRPAMLDALAPTRELFPGQSLAEANLEGRITVNTTLTMPGARAAPTPVSRTQAPAPMPNSGARTATLADVRALLANPTQPTPADCAAVTAWIGRSAAPAVKPRFDNLTALWVRRAGGGAAVAGTAQTKGAAIEKLVLDDRAFAAQTGRPPSQDVLNVLSAAARACSQP